MGIMLCVCVVVVFVVCDELLAFDVMIYVANVIVEVDVVFVVGWCVGN